MPARMPHRRLRRPMAVLALMLALNALLSCGRMPGAVSQNGEAAASDTAIRYSPGELVVKYLPAQAVGDRYRYPGAQVIDRMTIEALDDTELVELPPGTSISSAIQAYQAHGVDFAEQHYQLRLQPAPPSGRQLLDTSGTSAQWYLSHLQVQQAWPTSNGSGSVVAEVDTGVDLSHPDLQGQIIPGPVYSGTGSLPIDGFGHGTHVAGIIAATGLASGGTVGIAPGSKVLAIKCLDNQGRGGIFSVVRGIVYAANWGRAHHQHVIINLSLGGPAGPDPLDWLAGWYAHEKGALLIAAAGNSNGPVGDPASLGSYVAVGATDQQDQRASFSNFGSQLALVAPGVNIWSTTPTYHVAINDMGYSEDYASLSGTSMAAPIVSGVAALIWSAHPTWTNDQVRDQLEKTAYHLGNTGRNADFGYGLVSPLAALGVDPKAQMLPIAVFTPAPSATPFPTPTPSPTPLVFRPN